MAQLKMYDLSIFVNETHDIMLSQCDPSLDSPNIIALHPAQVSMVITWLKLAKQEAETT